MISAETKSEPHFAETARFRNGAARSFFFTKTFAQIKAAAECVYMSPSECAPNQTFGGERNKIRARHKQFLAAIILFIVELLAIIVG